MDLNLASRSYGSNENSPLVSGSVSPKRWIPPSSQPTQSKRRKSIGSTPSFRSLDTSAKLDHIFDVLKDLEWSLGDLLHHLFVWRVDSKRIPFSKRHAAYVQRYLGGDSNSSVSEVLEAWLTTPYGRPRTDNDSADMFSTRKDYRDINVARPAVTSFAAQIVKSRLQEEAQQATRKSTGLYAPIRQKNINANITWKDLGSSSLAIVKTELKKYQPLTLSYMQAVAQGSPRKRNGVTVVRCRNRPTELAAVNALASLDFCRSTNARLVPLLHGILYLASTVPLDIIAYNSRLGTMPSVNTLKSGLKALSDSKAVLIRALGREITTHSDQETGEAFTYMNSVLFDNVQHFLRQRDHRIGRENGMVLGIAATFFQVRVSPRACDPDERQRLLDLNKRENFTIDQLVHQVDQSHLRNIGILQWIGALAKYIPELEHLQAEVSLRYRTRCRKLMMPPGPTRLHPLASSGKNEAIIGELKDAFVDFLEQLGQCEDDYDHRLWLGGGDGMSFNNMLTMKKHLQAHEDPFQRFEYLIPVLQLWHTMWTDLGRIFESHWGELLDDNPATLAHSAKKIGRSAPSNPKKVDYYPSMELLELVHDLRMLDCWRLYWGANDIFEHFVTLDTDNAAPALPTFEQLETIAGLLFDQYSTAAAQHQAATDARTLSSQWGLSIPKGDTWRHATSTTASNLSSDASGPGQQSKKKKAKNQQCKPSATADYTLAETITFMRDASICREAAFAAKEGDVGRVWEAIKVVMVFTFAGSNHGKYTNYLLEMICMLELESNAELKDAILHSMLINLTGHPGDWQPADIVQELLNRCLEPVIQRKDAQFGSFHIRNHWARNIVDIYKLKSDARESVGLGERSGKHKKPHENPEVRILLDEYRRTQVHSRRPGRLYGSPRDVDDMRRGINKLSKGGLAKWVERTVKSRGMREVGKSGSASEVVTDSVRGQDSADERVDDEVDSEEEPEEEPDTEGSDVEDDGGSDGGNEDEDDGMFELTGLLGSGDIHNDEDLVSDESDDDEL
ncbi:hypothetical protein EYR40_009733 [Pleurotus pulmonarius]|nr:hypothetical protein EYR38_002774 [Pleurotus pulmonarius]KAF4591133.1 hypothetical protein EYR40_009733 [Pleurotus pulmonarius]